MKLIIIFKKDVVVIRNFCWLLCAKTHNIVDTEPSPLASFLARSEEILLLV